MKILKKSITMTCEKQKSLVCETLQPHTNPEDGRWYPQRSRIKNLFEHHLRVHRTPRFAARRAVDGLPLDLRERVLRVAEDFESSPRDRVLTEMVHHFVFVFCVCRETGTRTNLFRTIRSPDSPFPWLRRGEKENGTPLLVMCRLNTTGLAYCKAFVRWYYRMSEGEKDTWWDAVNAFGTRKPCPEKFYCGVSPLLHLRIFSGFHNLTSNYVHTLLSRRFDEQTRDSVAPYLWKRWDGTPFVPYEAYAVRRKKMTW